MCSIQEKDVTKPPKSTPHSDLDGVHEDERPNVQTPTKPARATKMFSARPRRALAGLPQR
jgi:hypothetical protein